MLIGNYSVLNKTPGRWLGGSGASVEVAVRSNWGTTSSSRARFVRDQGVGWDAKSAVPNGYIPPYSWVLPLKTGGLSAYSTIVNPNTVTAGMSSGINVASTMTSAGALSSTMQALANLLSTMTSDGSLLSPSMQSLANCISTMLSDGPMAPDLDALANMAATLVNDGTLTASLALVVSLATAMVSDGHLSAGLTLLVSCSASMLSDAALTPDCKFAANLAATLASQGDLAAAMGAIAWCVSVMANPGGLDASTLRGTADMAAVMSGAGEVLTASAVAQAVWETLATAFDTPGTMGAIQNLLRKMQTNRLEETSGNPGYMRLYDDDGTTVLLTWTIRDENGNAVAAALGDPARRGSAT